MFLLYCGRVGQAGLAELEGAPVAPGLEAGLAGLEVAAPDSPGLEAELAAPEDEVEAPVELELFDGGAVPDQVGNDGMYARYFTGYI